MIFFSPEKKKNEEGYKRVLHSLIEVLKCNMDPEAVLDGLIKYEIGRRNNHMNIKVSIVTTGVSEIIAVIILKRNDKQCRP